MNLRAIRALRKKFILISTVTYFLVMLFMGGSINLANFLSTHHQIRLVLAYLIQNEGGIPEDSSEEISEMFPESMPESAGSSTDDKDSKERRKSISESELLDFSPEFRYSTRYFSVIFDDQGKIIRSNLNNIAAVSSYEAHQLARRALGEHTTDGHYGYYYYQRAKTADGTTIVAFLYCKTQINTNIRILTYTILIAAAGLIITFILVNLFSNRVIKPEIENLRRQKQFVTNASHELKTPLAVIRANTEIEEMLNGSNEWTQSTMRQVDRLSGLVANLVMISRAQEREDRSVMGEIDVSSGVEETVRPYESLAQQDQKKLDIQIARDIRMVADESKIRQLASLLIDNAFKYCDDQGTIRVKLDSIRKGKTIRLAVSNSFKEGQNADYSRYFERFYREDESHNTDKGGYGIGLSIAESICQQYGGNISVTWKDGEIIFTCILVSG